MKLLFQKKNFLYSSFQQIETKNFHTCNILFNKLKTPTNDVVLPDRRNKNQQAIKQEKTLESLRKKLLQAKKSKEERPFAIEDKHVLEARNELEELQKEKLRKKGIGEQKIIEILREERELWVQNTKEAKERRESETS